MDHNLHLGPVLTDQFHARYVVGMAVGQEDSLGLELIVLHELDQRKGIHSRIDKQGRPGFLAFADAVAVGLQIP